MIILYDIVNHKTDIRGFWQEGKTLFKDNIQILAIQKSECLRFNFAVQVLFEDKKQNAIFYKIADNAFIQDKLGNVEILKTCERFYFEKLKPSTFKKLLKENGGFTVYKRKTYFMIELWKT
jgi:hypothetical protein